MIRWIGLPLLSATFAYFTFRYHMTWPWPLALLIAFSIAALAYSTQRAAERMLRILRPADGEYDKSRKPGTPPGGEQQRNP